MLLFAVTVLRIADQWYGVGVAVVSEWHQTSHSAELDTDVVVSVGGDYCRHGSLSWLDETGATS